MRIDPTLVPALDAIYRALEPEADVPGADDTDEDSELEDGCQCPEGQTGECPACVADRARWKATHWPHVRA